MLHLSAPVRGRELNRVNFSDNACFPLEAPSPFHQAGQNSYPDELPGPRNPQKSTWQVASPFLEENELSDSGYPAGLRNNSGPDDPPPSAGQPSCIQNTSIDPLLLQGGGFHGFLPVVLSNFRDKELRSFTSKQAAHCIISLSIWLFKSLIPLLAPHFPLGIPAHLLDIQSFMPVS